MQRSVLAAILMIATGAFAQPGDNPDHLYPNTASFGVKADPGAPWFQQCMRVRHVPTPPAPPKPAACSNYDYYLKLAQTGTSAAEWGKVRACAAAQQDDAVLSMLHANGQGVPRDLDVATYYACRAGGASAELSGRVMHLQALKTQPPVHYDQCDDITSGYMMGMCAVAAENQAAQARDTWLTALRRRLPAQQVGAFDQLLAATRAYSKARGGETDLSGTARAALVVAAESGELDWLHEHLAAFEQGKLQLPPPARFARTDAQLNRRYQALMNTPGALAGTTTRVEVRTAQRAWIVYRDAWVRFAGLRYPALPADALKTTLTQARFQQLDGMGGT